MDKLYEESETGCCLRFNPEPWDEKEITFQDRLFVKDHVRSFFHIPLNFGKVMVRNMERISEAKALPKEPLLLSDEKSLWGSDIYIAVEKEIPETQKMSAETKGAHKFARFMELVAKNLEKSKPFFDELELKQFTKEDFAQ